MSENNSVVSKKISPRKKNSYTAQFKLDRALEVIRSNNVAEISRKYNLNPNLLYIWRDQLIERGPAVYENAPDQAVNELKTKISRLEQMLGKKEVELSLLKNFSDFYSSRNTSS
jgi:transposase-like protein